jgi:hypothetical protein
VIFRSILPSGVITNVVENKPANYAVSAVTSIKLSSFFFPSKTLGDGTSQDAAPSVARFV